MKEIATSVLTVFGCLMLSALLMFAYQLLHLLFERLKQKTNNDIMKLIIDKLDYIVKMCVEATNQTFVDDLKQSDKFDKNKQEEAFMHTTTAIENMLTDDDKEKIIDSFGDVDTFIKIAIENYIKNSKINP